MVDRYRTMSQGDWQRRWGGGGGLLLLVVPCCTFLPLPSCRPCLPCLHLGFVCDKAGRSIFPGSLCRFADLQQRHSHVSRELEALEVSLGRAAQAATAAAAAAAPAGEQAAAQQQHMELAKVRRVPAFFFLIISHQMVLTLQACLASPCHCLGVACRKPHGCAPPRHGLILLPAARTSPSWYRRSWWTAPRQPPASSRSWSACSWRGTWCGGGRARSGGCGR